MLFMVINISKQMNRYNDIKQLELSVSYELKETDMNILDNMIQEVFTEYRILNLEHSDTLYISDKIQTTIMKSVLREVLLRISPTLKNKIGLYYNEDYINDIIYKKIQLLVIDYTITVNTSSK